MEVDEGSDKTSDIYPHWTAAHARLKNEFTEDETYHNLTRWFKCCIMVATSITRVSSTCSVEATDAVQNGCRPGDGSEGHSYTNVLYMCRGGFGSGLSMKMRSFGAAFY